MPQPKTVLVTGASGFIAKHICLRLLNAGYHVVGSVRTAERGPEVVAAVSPYLDSQEGLSARLITVTLDLDRDDGWREALNGIDILIHTASPFPMGQPEDEQSVIRPAVEGTLRALRAARSAGVSRVVMTSSTVAIMNTALPPGRTVYDENDWSDLTRPTAIPYVKSKTLAEQAAWRFVEEEAREIALTVVNPAFVLGPPLDNHLGTSLLVIRRLLRSKDPALPNIGFASVDVRDIAEMHVRALSSPETVGRRIIGSDRFFWFLDMAKTLAAAYPDRKIAARRAPNWLVRILALFDKPVRSIVPNLDERLDLSNQLARDLLGMEFMDVEQSLLESAGYLIEHGLDR
ncbi:MAG: aldehyde reductase [Pseudomonadota bacterium]